MVLAVGRAKNGSITETSCHIEASNNIAEAAILKFIFFENDQFARRSGDKIKLVKCIFPKRLCALGL